MGSYPAIDSEGCIMTIYSAKRILKESLPFALFLLTLSWITGSVLEDISYALIEEYIYLFVTLPIFLTSVGDIGCVFVSRLTSHLHLGELSSSFKPYRVLFSNIFGIIVTSIGYFVLLAFLGYGVAVISGASISIFQLLLVFLTAGLLTTSILYVLGIFVTMIAFRKGLDPDNFTSPLIANTGDMIGTFTLALLITTFLI